MSIAVDSSKWSLLHVTYQHVCIFQRFLQYVLLVILLLNIIIFIYNGPTNALVCIKTLIQLSHTKTFKITPTCFDHQMIIMRELSDPG
jgi:disulfide bond formation protein DsbB